MISHQIKTINKDIKEIYQVEILDLKTTITEMENSLECLNNKSEQAEERISTFEYRSITQSEEYKGKKWKKNKQNLRDVGKTNKHAEIGMMGVPEGEERKKRTESISEKTMDKSFPN